MCRFSPIKSSPLFLGCLLACLFLFVTTAHGQGKKGLPDSLAADETITVGPERNNKPAAAVTDSVTDELIDSAKGIEQSAAKTDTFVMRSVPDSAIKKYKADPDFAYANDPDYWKREQPQPPGKFMQWLARILFSDGLRWFIYLVLVSALAYALYKIIVDNRLYLFYSKPKKTPAAITGEDEIHREDLDERIRESVGSGNFRLATRYQFLKALRVADDGRLIQYHPQLTNSDYLQQLNNRPQQQSFRLLSRAYEHVWYGDFPLAASQYEWLQKEFNNFNKSIQR